MATTRKTTPIDSLPSWEIDARATDARSAAARARWAAVLRARDRANCERFKQTPQESYSREEAAELLGVTPATLRPETSFSRAGMEALMIDWHGPKEDRAAETRSRSRKASGIRELYLEPKPAYAIDELARLFATSPAEINSEFSGWEDDQLGGMIARHTVLSLLREFASPSEIEAALGDDFARVVPQERAPETLTLAIVTERWVADRLRREAASHGRTIEAELANLLEGEACDLGSPWSLESEVPPYELPIADVILSGDHK